MIFNCLLLMIINYYYYHIPNLQRSYILLFELSLIYIRLYMCTHILTVFYICARWTVLKTEFLAAWFKPACVSASCSLHTFPCIFYWLLAIGENFCKPHVAKVEFCCLILLFLHLVNPSICVGGCDMFVAC